MNSRERIDAALSPDGTLEIPAVICYEDIFVRDHWSELSPEPWWIQLVPDTEQQTAWREQVAHALDQDWFMVPGGFSSKERARWSMQERDV